MEQRLRNLVFNYSRRIGYQHRINTHRADDPAACRACDNEAPAGMQLDGTDDQRYS
jgi:hypothetical protein